MLKKQVDFLITGMIGEAIRTQSDQERDAQGVAVAVGSCEEHCRRLRKEGAIDGWVKTLFDSRLHVERGFYRFSKPGKNECAPTL